MTSGRSSINHLRIGTRGSLLAMAQSNLVKDAILRANPAYNVELVEVTTTGDRKQGTAAAEQGDKKEWILELERAVLAGQTDLAVHSGKDVPCDIEAGTEIVPILEREDPSDVFIGKRLPDGNRMSWKDLPQGALVGTSSLRRKASLLRLRPDLQVVSHRGNVPTRLRKLDESADLSGIVLAAAGIRRLGIADLAYEAFSSSDLMPAINQAILVVQYAKERRDLAGFLAQLVHRPTQYAFNAERGCVSVLGADCKSSVSIYAKYISGEVSLSVRVMSGDGRDCVEILDQRCQPADALNFGMSIGRKALELGGASILASQALKQ
ncbi:MAG: hydroxymethylbilane synthase [Proteobacteria bacterium]|nr:MAG: hydroxymethylbilane synthase [Pseudomonadota bacterium]